MAGNYSKDWPEFEGINETDLDGWLAYRKERRHGLTQAAINQLVNACAYHKITLAEAIHFMAAVQWISIRKSFDLTPFRKEFFSREVKQDQPKPQTQTISDEERQKRVEKGREGAKGIRQALLKVV